MNRMKDFIDQENKDKQELYFIKQKLIIQEYERETADWQDYHGRELLELLQNADDEALDELPKKVFIRFCDGTLEVSNYGRPFTQDGIESLMYSNTSPKRDQEKETIGNKGTGFRSILSWAEEIEINSGDLHVRFTEAYSQSVLQNVLQRLRDNNIKIEKNVDKVATLAFPEWIESYNDNQEYTTSITIKIKDDEDVINDIIKQIKNLDQNILLFLNNTEELVIEMTDYRVRYEKEKVGGKTILRKYMNDEPAKERHWTMLRTDGLVPDDKDKLKEKNYHVIIAYCDDELDDTEKYIYSYFKTEEEFPYSFLLHASFALKSDRNHITNSKANEVILNAAAELMVQAAIKVGRRKTANYDIVKMLIPTDNKLPKTLSGTAGSVADFKRMIFDAVKKSGQPILPNVNDKYIIFEPHKTLRYYNGLSKYVKGREFNKLLKHFEKGSNVDQFIKEFTDEHYIYKYDSIVPMVEKWVKRQDLKTDNEENNKEKIRNIIKTALCLFDEYKKKYRKGEQSFPEVFINSDREVIQRGKPIYIVEDEGISVSKLPKFAQIEFMEPYMASFLLKYLGQDNGTEFGDLKDLEEYNIRPFIPEEIILHLNECLEQSIKNEKPAQTKKKWISTIKWIWNNRKCFEQQNCIKVYFLGRDKQYHMSNVLYMGKEYGNELIEDLLGSNNPAFAADINSIEGFNLSEKDINELMSLLGVERLPRILPYKYEVYPYYLNRNREYISKVLSNVKYPCNIEDGHFDSLEDCVSKLTYISFKTSTIKELETILNNSHTESIVEWIREDAELKRILINQQDKDISKVEIKWGSKYNTRTVPKLTRPYPYILYLFETIPWIEAEGNRYCVNDCIMDMNAKVSLTPYLVQPNISDYIKNINGTPAQLKKEYVSIFQNLGMKKGIGEFAKLPAGKIYSVLKALPDIEGSETVTRTLYRVLTESSDLEIVECKERTDFIKNGKVLCNNGFVNVSEAYYLDKKTVSDRITDNYNIIRIQSRQGIEKVKKIFGVERLDIKGKIVGEPVIHKTNTAFSVELKRFLPMAFCCWLSKLKSDDNAREKARIINNTKIILCSCIKAIYNDEFVVELNDYEYILAENHAAYIKAPGYLSSDQIKHNMDLSMAVAGALCSSIDLSEVQDLFRELFYCGNNREREKLLTDKFEDNSIIDRAKEYLDFSEDIQDEFISIIKTIAGSDINTDMLTGLDFDEFSGVGNSREIIRLFKGLGLDVSDYNAEIPSVDIDLVPYYEGEISRIKSMYQEKYKISCFRRLENSPVEEKILLEDEFHDFDQIRISAENSVYFDVEKAVVDQLKINFEAKPVNLPDLYKRNKRKWEKACGLDKRFIDEFLSYYENKSLLYFREYELLTRKYEKYIEEHSEDEDLIIDSPANQQLREVFPVHISPLDMAIEGKSRTSRRTGYSKKDNQEENVEIGIAGEWLVYLKLKSDENFKMVNWVSENAEKKGINPEGKAGFGYDIEVIDRNDTRILIEVKASKSPLKEKVVFHLTDLEKEVALKNAGNYIIYYVGNVYDKSPEFFKIADLFEDDFNTEKYSVDCKCDYIISARIE